MTLTIGRDNWLNKINNAESRWATIQLPDSHNNCKIAQVKVYLYVITINSCQTNPKLIVYYCFTIAYNTTQQHSQMFVNIKIMQISQKHQ